MGRVTSGAHGLQSWGRVAMSPLWWKCPLAIGSSEHQLQKDSSFSQGGKATSQRPQDGREGEAKRVHS